MHKVKKFVVPPEIIISDVESINNEIQQKKQDIKMSFSIKKCTNWYFKLITILYLTQTYDLRIHLNTIHDRLIKSTLNICSCNVDSIPNYFSLNYNKQFLIQVYNELCKSILQIIEGKQNNKHQKIIKLMDQMPYFQFIFELIIRAQTIQYSKKIINNYAYDFLGNQIQVLKNYSLKPQYKIISLIASTYKYQIYQLSQNSVYYNFQQQPFLKISLSNQKQYIHFSYTNYHRKNHIKNSISTADSSSKNFLDVFFQKSPRQFQKSIPKVCPKCGQKRQLLQKFCPCRKVKISSNTSIGKN